MQIFLVTLPADFPKPPEISILYLKNGKNASEKRYIQDGNYSKHITTNFCPMYAETFFQLTPCGTTTPTMVGRR